MCGAYPDALFCKTYGIVGLWLFNEKGSKIIDVCRNFNTGAISGAAWTASKMGGGLRFDGSDDYANIGRTIQHYADYNKPFSIAVWFNMHTFSGAGTYSLMGAVHQVGGVYDQFELNVASDKIRAIFLNVGAGSDGWIWDTTSTIGGAVGKQFCVVWTYDGLNASTSPKMYINGINYAVTVTTNAGIITQSMWQAARLDKDIWVGRRNFSTGDQPFPGTIDQMIISNRVWTQSDVTKFYRNPWCGLISSTQLQSESSQMAVMGAD